MKNYHYSRRDFLQTMLTGMAAGATMMSFQKQSSDGIPTRPLGTTGEQVSIIGIGGWDISSGNLTEKESVDIMLQAIDEGITFFDNCWDYHDGISEERMGKALSAPGRREKVFLMTKGCGRDYKTARKHIEDSLRRLKTDFIDLWQFHAIKWDDDPDLIFAEEGAIKAAIEARDKGQIKYIGFTGHQNPRHHLRMLEKDFTWDTVQMPTNMLDFHYESFQKQVLPVCVERKIGVIGMKALAAQQGKIPRELGISAKMCRRYALSLPVSALVCGISSKKDLNQDIAIARDFKPLNEYEIKALVDEVKADALTGHIEIYKTGNYGCDWYHKNVM